VSSLGFALDQGGGKKVVITSSSVGEGKTATALNIAIAAAGDGRTPLLIDADERARGLTRMSGFGIAPGITDADPESGTGAVVQKWLVEGEAVVEFVPAGKKLGADTERYFRSPQFKEGLAKLTTGYDLVLIDTPPVLAAPEATDIAAEADGIILVVRRGTALSDIEDACDRLTMAGTPIIGYVFNWAKGAGGTYAYKYGS
jgi:Mrp family chromosome partitioning ATPase